MGATRLMLYSYNILKTLQCCWYKFFAASVCVGTASKKNEYQQYLMYRYCFSLTIQLIDTDIKTSAKTMIKCLKQLLGTSFGYITLLHSSKLNGCHSNCRRSRLGAVLCYSISLYRSTPPYEYRLSV